MRKVGYAFGLLAAIAAVIAIVFFGRQYQAQHLREQAAEHHARTAQQSSVTPSAKAAPASSSSAKAEPERHKLNYVAIGDSLAAGDFTTRENDAYQYVITRQLKEARGADVVLDGFWEEGATIASLALPNYNGILAMKPDLITIEFGTNEQDPTNAYYAQPQTFQTNLAGLVQKLQADLPKAKIALLTTWQPEANSAYDQAIQAVGTQANVPVVNIAAVSQAPANIAKVGDASWNGQGDGYHPNSAGNQAIAALAVEKIKPLLD